MKETNKNTSEDKNKEDLTALYQELDFSCEYSDNLPEILKRLNISIAFTSYQAGRLIFLRSDGESIDVNFTRFSRPMGLAATENGLTLGVFSNIINFQREDGLLEMIKQPLQKIEDDITAPKISSPKSDKSTANQRGETPDFDKQLSAEQLAERKKDKEDFLDYQKKLYEPVDERVDACFISRSVHYSGMINIHDIAWGEDGLWAVNSSFSCLCTIEPDFSFVPRWKPYFISELVSEDRCHLNGMALIDGRPAYVTTFSKLDQQGAWRDGNRFDGTLMDVQKNRIVLDGLAMPHSPRWQYDSVYFCNSGYGQVCCFDPETKQNRVIAELQGFTRGMDFYGPILFVGLSKTRASDVSMPAPLNEKFDQTYSGIWLLNTEEKNSTEQKPIETIAQIMFTGNVDQIYDVAVIPNCSFPELIEPSHPRMRNHFCHPELQQLD